MMKSEKITHLILQNWQVLKKKKILFAASSAMLGIMALSPRNLYFLGFVFLVPFFYFLYTEKNFWKLFLGTFVFRLLFALGSVYYTFEPLTWIMSMGIFLGLPVAIFLLKHTSKSKHIASLIYIPLVYLLFDFLQARYSYLPTYIITVGNILGESPFVGLAKNGGLVSLGFLVVTVNIFLLGMVMNWRFILARRKNVIVFLACLAILFIGAYGLSKNALKINSTKTLAVENELRITTVSLQKNFSPKMLGSLLSQLRDVEADLIVLPEELLVKPGNEPFELEEISRIIEAYGFEADYIIGTFHMIKKGKHYNETLVFDKQGKTLDQYDKNRLTIMGEYWPYAWHPTLYDFLQKDPAMKNYAIFNRDNTYASGSAKLLEIAHKSQSVKFGALICLEGHYPDMLDSYVKGGAKFIVNPTSNRWLAFGSQQYDYLVKNLYLIEAVQSGLPMAVSAVNGFAGIIYPDARKSIVSGENEFGYVVSSENIRY